MDRAEALVMIGAVLKYKYGTQGEAAKAIGLSQATISRVFHDDWRPISPKLLELAGLEAVTPPTTYRRKV